MINTVSRSLMEGVAGLLSPAGQRARLSILIYHRVLPAADSFNKWDVTASEFELQMKLLARHFSPLPLTEAVERLATGSLPARAVCVTFDDGYADNAEVALPILVKNSVPATFFIATGYLDGGRMWNDTVSEAIRVLAAPTLDLDHWGLGTFVLDSVEARRAAITASCPRSSICRPRTGVPSRAPWRDWPESPSQSELMMRDDQVRELHVPAWKSAPTRLRTRYCGTLRLKRARREIVESGRRLAEIVRQPIRLFAYPNGKPGRGLRSGACANGP